MIELDGKVVLSGRSIHDWPPGRNFMPDLIYYPPMTAQQIMQDLHVARIRALKDEVARLKAELARAREEHDSLRRHFALALLAAQDAERIGPDGTLLIVDGWNAILGSENVGGQRDRLTQLARAWLAAHPADRAWIVFDGHEANGSAEGRLRVSYTGGTGAHRADRLVCDYLRMRRYAGASGNVTVVTNDKDFRKEAERLGAKTEGIGEWTRK